MGRHPVSYPKDMHAKAKAEKKSLATIEVDGVYESDPKKQVRITVQFPCNVKDRDGMIRFITRLSHRWNKEGAA